MFRRKIRRFPSAIFKILRISKFASFACVLNFGEGVISPANENLEREGVLKRKRAKREKVKFGGFSDRKCER